MAAEKALKALEKRKGAYVSVPPWMEWKSKQEFEADGVIHLEQSWIPCPGRPWKHDLHVSVYAPVDGSSIKAMVIGFHGLGNFGDREYYYFAPWFAKQGFAVIIPDLPYFGHNVMHRGTHGRIGKWDSQLVAMTECIKWGLAWTRNAMSMPADQDSIPWYMVGISMSGLGVIDYGLKQFNEKTLGVDVVKSCNAIVSLVPALKFRLEISPVMKFLALLAGNIAPNFVFDQQSTPDPATGLAPVSHDKECVQWCIPSIERGSDFGLAGENASKEFELDCFPGSPVSTVVKLYFASRRAYDNAARWPNVPIFCTGSGLDDLVDPSGAADFVSRIDQKIIHQFKLYDDFYHPQLCELGRETLFQDILAFWKNIETK
jgi:alpha-beta hydrolase superfamily lysophospholipase